MNDVIGMSITEGINIDIRISPMPKVCLAKNVSYTTTWYQAQTIPWMFKETFSSILLEFMLL